MQIVPNITQSPVLLPSRTKYTPCINMKMIFVLAALVAVSLAAPLDDSKNAVILRYDNDVSIGSDGYKWAYETSDGSSRSEQGELKNAGTENEALSVTGTVSWVGADGVQYTLNYIADENGFRPEGAHLPKA